MISLRYILKNKPLFYIIIFIFVILILFFVFFYKNNFVYYIYFKGIVDSKKNMDMYIDNCRKEVLSKNYQGSMDLDACIYEKSYSIAIEKAVNENNILICDSLYKSDKYKFDYTCNDRFYFEISIKQSKNQCVNIIDDTLKKRCNYFFDFEGAKKESIEKNRIERCFEIVIESQSNDCIDNFYYQKAKKEQDKSYCENLISDKLRDTCFTSINDNDYVRHDNIIVLTGSIDKEKSSTGSSIDPQKLNSIINDAINSSNIKKCDEIKDQSMYSFCKDQYYAYQAGKNNDKKMCDNIQGKENKKACIEEYILHNLENVYANQDKNPEEFCSIFSNEELKKSCLLSLKSLKSKTSNLSLTGDIISTGGKNR